MPDQRNLGDVIRSGPDPERLGLIDLGQQQTRRFSFGELDNNLKRAAQALLSQGFTPGSSIGVLGSNSFEYLTAKLAIMRAGLVAVPINHRLPADAILDISRDSGLRAVFTTPEVGLLVNFEIPRFGLTPGSFQAFISDEGAPSSVPRPGETARILYTSGSTGRPKGVELSHQSQWSIVDGMCRPGTRQALERRRGIIAAPLFHMNALVFSEALFHLGGSVVLLPRFEAGSFIQAIHDHRVEVITGVPTMLALMAREEELLQNMDLSCVSVVYIGSAPLSDLIVRQARRLFPEAAILNGYGTTETGAGTFGSHPKGVPRPPLSIGHPAPHVSVRLVDGPSPDQGVLEIHTPSRMTRYRNLPELTQDKIREGWINTGDIMRRDKDGFLYFVGRADDMFNCSGENIYPGEVERMLERHPDILEVCVIPCPDPTRGHVPVAFLVTRPGCHLDAQAVKEYSLAHAAPHVHPRKVHFLSQMPLAGTNKIDRRELAEQARRQAEAAP